VVFPGLSDQVTLECDRVRKQYGRQLYQTPKSYLQYLDAFKALYTRRWDGLVQESARVEAGLQKLRQGAEDVEALRRVLQEEEAGLIDADVACEALMKDLQTQSQEAERESLVVAKIREGCEASAAEIAVERDAAKKDLAAATPFLDEAMAAIDNINAQVWSD
jgi:dynein heavy chain, axonemal